MLNERSKGVFITYEQFASPYVETYFVPLLSRINMQIDVYQLCSNAPSKEITEVVHNYENVKWFVVPTNKYKRLTGITNSAFILRKRIKLGHSNSDLLIYRSVIGGLFAILLKFSGLRFHSYLYDSDGLAIDERIEFRVWRKYSVITICAKLIEIISLKISNGYLVRTSYTTKILEKRFKFLRKKKSLVLINGRPKEIFVFPDLRNRINLRSKYGIAPESTVMLYVGSIGPQYLFEETTAIFRKIKEISPSVELVIATISNNQEISKFLPKEILDDRFDVHILHLKPSEIIEVMSFSNVGICLRANSESMKHVAPLKLREYLLSGVPVIYTDNTGDNFLLPDSFAYRYILEAPNRIDSLVSWWMDHIAENFSESNSLAQEYALEFLEIERDSEALRKFLKTI